MISNKWNELYKVGDRVLVYTWEYKCGCHNTYKWLNAEVMDYRYNPACLRLDDPDQKLPIEGLIVRIEGDPESPIRSVLSFDKVIKLV